MPPSALLRSVTYAKKITTRLSYRQRLLSVFGVLLLCCLTVVEFNPFNAHQADALNALNHTVPTVDQACNRLAFTSDGNPFGLCPGPAPGGGNCVWWAWEQWHLLDYNLPGNWGNAADWAVDAERTGLPLGTMPRVGSIAVFPVADGVWAFGAAGHVAFVTWVSPDGNSFNVTYQNYGDPTNMHVGIGYNVSVINEARFQNGQLRFIYFPKTINAGAFARLPGVSGNDVAGAMQANTALGTTSGTQTLTGTHIALGLPPTSSDQEFNADFTGTGHSDLLMYNRQQGRLEIFRLVNNLSPPFTSRGKAIPSPIDNPAQTNAIADSQLISLSDATTSSTGWGSSLDIHVGDFDGSGQSEILLYDRISGQLQLLKLTPNLKIKQHKILPGWGPGWELYTGRFNGKSTGLFMYNRFANSPVTPVTVPTTGPTSNPPSSPAVNLPSPSPKPTQTPTPKPRPSPTPKPSPTPAPSPTPTQAIATPTSTSTAKSKSGLTTNQPPNSGSSVVSLNTNPDSNPTGNNLSGNTTGTEQNQSEVPNVILVDFKKDLSVNHLQHYTLSEDFWEIYAGSFVSPAQDGIFIYDRIDGQGRIMSFNSSLKLVHNQQIDNLDGNWGVYSGDFNGSGRAQILLYDPSSGDAQFLIFGKDLSLVDQKTYSEWGTNQILYVGHFGMASLNVMLYDPQAATSNFMAFDSSLEMTAQYTTQSWNQDSQILVGAFIDRSRCQEFGNCTSGDDILVLNRQTGEIEQYVFTFRPQFKVYDNRSQAFLREGLASIERLTPVDATSFSMLASLDTNIRDEELY